MKTQNISIVGKLGSTYGIRGWLRIYSSTEQAESIFDYQPWFLNIKGQWQTVELESWRYHSQDLIVKLKNIDDRDATQALTNIEIGVSADNFPELEEGYYWHDLIGCQVLNLQGYQLGVVSDMMETGSNDVMVVKSCADSLDDRERLLPYTAQCVLAVDLTAGEMQVDWDADF